MTAREQSCADCGRAADPYGGHGNFRDRGDGYCELCGRMRAWHAGTTCFCRCSTGMPSPVEPLQATLFDGAPA